MSDAAGDLARGLEELGIAASAEQRGSLLGLAQLVERWGSRINLTGHRDLDAITRDLVLSSAALASALPELSSLADLGSGAGFPGLPIAILRPGCEVSLIEARHKKHHFQRAACRSLGLSNATPILGRAEVVEAILHDAAIAQAVAQPSTALAMMLRWVGIGGLVLLPGASEPPSVESSRVETLRVERYRVPLGGPPRSLWIGRRIS